MLECAENYITNIPWQNNPAFAFGNDEEEYSKAFSNVLEYVPGTDRLIKFSDDTWDFRPYYKDINTNTYVIRFNNSDDFKEYLKFYVLYAIGNKSKISTVSKRVQDFIRVINRVKEGTNHKSFSIINTDDIVSILENDDVSNSARSAWYVCLHLIYDFIYKNYEIELPVEIDVLKEKSAHYKALSKKDERTNNIPEELYLTIINKCIEVMNNEEINLSDRMTACMIIICSQTGLRRQDLVALKITDLKSRKLPVSKVTANYLHYQTRKPSKAHSDMLEFDIIASPLCVEAFNTMLSIRKNSRYHNQPYLYVPDNIRDIKEFLFPVAPHTFHKHIINFYFRYMFEETQKEWEGIDKIIYSNGRDENKIVQMSVPKLSQFRVHLATSLYENGVTLNYIQKYLGHLTEYMIGYYVRPKDKGPENADYAEKTITKIVGKDMTPLGLMGEDLKRNLMKFIQDGNYNVKTDIKQIISDLGDRLIIREKGGGLCCIKTSIIPCKYDARTDETLCAYGLCPNIFHFYDMIDVTYMQFHALQESYQTNLDNGYSKAAQKELGKLKDFIRRRLKPELEELKKVTKDIDIQDFALEHPNLKHIALNLESIENEVALWEKC